LENIKSLKILEGYEEQYKIAIHHFSNENYIEFMYMSPVLIENILKKYLIQIEGDSISYRNGKFTDKTLEQVIEKLLEDDKCYIDKTILKIISYILVDSNGMNLRNEILHANFSDDYFNKVNAMNIYIILIFLIRYFYSSKE
jgi:DNA polymerase elongation subunit (family B)